VFVGTHLVGVDGKGRVSIPAPFRAALRGADQVFVWPSFRGAYLEAADQPYLEGLRQALAGRGAFDQTRADLDYAIFAEARALTFDETGRVTLDGALRQHALLDGKAAFGGVGERFEIWDPARLDARKSAARDNARRGQIDHGAPA
jgi:MraZ protein